MIREESGGGGVGHFEGMGRVPCLDGGGLPGAEFVLGGPHPSRRQISEHIAVCLDEVGVSDQDDPCVSRIGQPLLNMRQQCRRFRHRGTNFPPCCIYGVTATSHSPYLDKKTPLDDGGEV